MSSEEQKVTEQQAPSESSGKMIHSNKVYAIRGATILGITELLRDRIPSKYIDVVLAVEEALATVSDLETVEKAES